jgi:hypothetical protein
MQNAPIKFSFAGLPAAYCFTTPQRFALDIASGLSGFLPGDFAKIIRSEDEPDVSQRIDSLWFKPSQGRLYYYDGGWINRNLADAIDRRWVEATPAEIWAYDGGDGTDPSTSPPTDRTGAMWEEDTNYAARFPLAAGTSPAPNSTVFGVGDTGGEEKHTLLPAELPKHSHKVQFIGTLCSVTSTTRFGGEPTGGTPDFGNADCPVTDSFGGDGTGVTTPHNTFPLYRCGRWIKRTGRLFYVG